MSGRYRKVTGRGEKRALEEETHFLLYVGETADDIETFIAQRIQAKQDKDYARADEIRSELEAQGILLEDSPEGTTWRRGA